MTNTHAEQCCPRFDPLGWDGKIFEWHDKRFIKDTVKTFLFMPINFGQVMKRLDRLVTNAEANSPELLCISDHSSKSNMDVYLAVDREIPNANNISLSGTFFSAAFEGDYKNTGAWCKDFERQARDRNLLIKKMYMWYTTCPKCAKKYGKNYTVIIGEIDSE